MVTQVVFKKSFFRRLFQLCFPAGLFFPLPSGEWPDVVRQVHRGCDIFGGSSSFPGFFLTFVTVSHLPLLFPLKGFCVL